MKSTYLRIVASIMIAIIILTTVVYFSHKPNETKNGFERKIFMDKIEKTKTAKIPSAIFTLSGSTSKNYFLSGDYPGKIWILDKNLTKIDSINITMPTNGQIRSGFDLFVDSPSVRLYARNLGTFFQNTITGSTINGVRFTSPLFSRVIEINKNSAIIRGFDTARTTQYFQKIDKLTGKETASFDLFKNEADAGFSTDGHLLFDSTTNSVIYILFYQNSYYNLDTNLTLKYKARTIDTTFTNTIKTRNTLGKSHAGSIMPSVPLNPVNKRVCTSNGLMYVASTLLADNESFDQFSNNTVIDVYNLTYGKYEGSFYLPDTRLDNIQSISLEDNKLICLQTGGISIFSLKSK